MRIIEHCFEAGCVYYITSDGRRIAEDEIDMVYVQEYWNSINDEFYFGDFAENITVKAAEMGKEGMLLAVDVNPIEEIHIFRSKSLLNKFADRVLDYYETLI